METIAKIRRDHRVQGKSIKAIARDRGVSRNTVRKVLRSDVTVLSYRRKAQPRRKLGGYETRLGALLERASNAPRRERWT